MASCGGDPPKSPCAMRSFVASSTQFSALNSLSFMRSWPCQLVATIPEYGGRHEHQHNRAHDTPAEYRAPHTAHPRASATAASMARLYGPS